MKVDLDELKKQLDSNEIINIIKTLVPDLRYEETNSYLILPTICHNKNSEDASMKLYYYFNTHLFFCYTNIFNSTSAQIYMTPNFNILLFTSARFIYVGYIIWHFTI